MNSAEVQPGHVVIVAGVGGVGINAVQGAKHAGATTLIAVDPLAFKREKAQEMGATHAFESIDEASELRQVGHQRPGRRQRHPHDRPRDR